MANNRKVQADIDRLLKKTQEGIEIYEELYDKFESAGNQSTKERLEGDLKKEIKKLQRQREQIKGYIASSEVKDTKSLEGYRKKVEEKMEAFKVCEREMKTKAFSKEGLASAGNERNGTPIALTESWLKSSIEEARKKMEIMEYEVQKVAGRGGRKGSKKSEAHYRLENLQIHFYKWEALLRMVINEEVDPSDVDDIRSNIDKVLEDDTDLDIISNMECYSDFDIPEPKVRTSSDEEEEKKVSPPITSVPAKAPASKASPTTTALKSPPSITHPETSASKSATRSQQSPTTVLKPPPMMLSDDGKESIPEWMDDDGANDDTFGDDAMGAAAAGSLAEMANATSKFTSDWEKRKLEMRTGAAASEPKSPDETSKKMSSPEAAAISSSSTTAAPKAPNDWEKRKLELKKTPSSTPSKPGEVSPKQQQPQPQQQQHIEAPATSAPVPTPANAAAPTISSSSPTTSTRAKYDDVTIHALLDVSLSNLPHTLDVERQRPYEPPNAIQPMPFFPQEVHPILSCKDIYHQFDLETLFFIFYYHQKSHQQYFASKELKAHSFRYHTELKRWYQRREKPTENTQVSERGAYTFFDYEDTWQKQDVDDFTFEYRYLEDDLN